MQGTKLSTRCHPVLWDLYLLTTTGWSLCPLLLVTCSSKSCLTVSPLLLNIWKILFACQMKSISINLLHTMSNVQPSNSNKVNILWEMRSCVRQKKQQTKKRFFWNGPYWKPLWALQLWLKCCTRWQDQPSLCVGSTTANWIDRLMPCDPYDVKKSEVGRRCWCNVTLILWHLKVRSRICT